VRGKGFRAQRTPNGIMLDFHLMRAAGPATGLFLFTLLCGLMPALGLSALPPLDNANASTLLSLALIGGLAAPFILASVVFAGLTVYLLANSLHVEINAERVRTERRLFGLIVARRELARSAIADVEPRISARYQNVFSTTPRYALIARHGATPSKDVIIAEDLSGQTLMVEMRALICATLSLK
jgi:hypothetical protein